MTNGWPLVPLGEALVERQEVPPDMALLTGKIPIVGKISFNDGIISLRDEGTTKTRMILIRPGDLVLSGINAAKGAIAVYGEENTKSIAATIHYGAYIPDRERVDVKFLWWLLRSSTFRVLLRQYLPGGIKTELKAKRLLPIPVPLPPLEEQRRIVTRIEELAAQVEAARALRQQAVEETKKLLGSAMKGFFDFSRAPTTVGDFASVLGGYAFRSSEYVENGSHQIVRIGNVRDGYLNLSRVPVFWDLRDDERLKKYELREGDILISMTGTRDKRDYGYIAMVPPGRKLLLNQRVGKVIPHAPIEKHYIAYFLRSPFFRDHLFPSATGTANQANVGKRHIERIPFCPPKSLEEQRRIVAYLDDLQAQVGAVKQHQAATGAALDALLPSILDRAFRGEL